MEKVKRTNFFRVIYKDYTMLIVLIALVIIGAVLSPSFLSVTNIMNILKQNAVTGVVALGFALVLIGGTFDMSVGSNLTLCAVVSLMLQEHIGALPAVLIALAVGVAVGLINGFIISALNGNSGDSFIITFGMLTLLQGLALIITKGNMVSGSKDPVYGFIGDGNIAGIPFSFILFVIFAIIVGVVLSKTTGGRKVYYMGANCDAARLSGIDTKETRLLVYVVSGLMAAIAAIMLTGRTNGTTPTAGQNMEFDAVTAIVVGGVSIKGGEGSIIHVVIGILIMGLIGNIMNIIGISSQNQLVVKGVVLVLAVILDNIKKKRA